MQRICAIVATVAFGVLFLITILSAHVDSTVRDGLLYGGLTAFAASHL